MNNLEYIAWITAVFLLFFYIVRLLIRVTIDFLLNSSNRKKRNNKQRLGEWLFYSRFIDVIPKRMLLLYCLNFFLYGITLVMTIVFCIINVDHIVFRTLLALYFFGYTLILTIIYIISINIKHRDLYFRKTITRKKRNKKY